jgi:hypothetical protein
MKKFILAASILAATAATAQAGGCSTNKLNGNWMFATESGFGYTFQIQNGVISYTGAPVGTISLGSKCKGAITIAGIGINNWTVRTERLDSDEDIKPGHIMFGTDLGGGAAVSFQMMRM